MIYAIRGATTINKDSEQDVAFATTELYNKIVEKNALDCKRIISVVISSTTDIKSYYPAKALRLSANCSAPLFSCLEPEIEGALPLCIRLMLTIDGEGDPVHVYLNKAKILRPDLISDCK